MIPRVSDLEEHVISLDVETLRAISSVRTGMDCNDEEHIPTQLIQVAINTLNSDSMTDEEKACGYFSRRRLRTLSNWRDWEAAEHKQLDQFDKQEMFGDPVHASTLPKDAVVLRAHWQYQVKRSGVRRSRLCCNGSKYAAPQLHAIAST